MALQGADELRRRFDAISSPRTEQAFLRGYGNEVLRRSKRELRKHRKTGTTARSGKVDVGQGHVSVSFGFAAPFLEEGTRAHIIRARRARALRFAVTSRGRRQTGTPRRGADVVFARSVRHPGTQPDPFLLPAARDTLRDAGLDHIVRAWDGAA